MLSGLAGAQGTVEKPPGKIKTILVHTYSF